MHTFYLIAVYESENVDLSVSAFEISHHWRTLSSYEQSANRNPSSWVEKNHEFIYDSFWKWEDKTEELLYGI